MIIHVDEQLEHLVYFGVRQLAASARSARSNCARASLKDDPADVARAGFDAMMRGDDDVVTGWKNKLQSAIANVTPAGVLAEQHRRMAEPLSTKKRDE